MRLKITKVLTKGIAALASMGLTGAAAATLTAPAHAETPLSCASIDRLAHVRGDPQWPL